jgi:hypothetical protein
MTNFLAEQPPDMAPRISTAWVMIPGGRGFPPPPLAWFRAIRQLTSCGSRCPASGDGPKPSSMEALWLADVSKLLPLETISNAPVPPYLAALPGGKKTARTPHEASRHQSLVEEAAHRSRNDKRAARTTLRLSYTVSGRTHFRNVLRLAVSTEFPRTCGGAWASHGVDAKLTPRNLSPADRLGLVIHWVPIIFLPRRESWSWWSTPAATHVPVATRDVKPPQPHSR